MIFSFTQNGRKLELDVASGVYYPREDSILLAKALTKEAVSGKILDLGCGSGFLSVLLASRGDVTAADIDAAAVKNTKHNADKLGLKIQVVQSNIFSNIHNSFDYIVFNPPYIPVAGEDGIWSGGTTGREVISRFASQCGSHLNDLGKVFIIFSSITGEKEVIDLFSNFETEIIARQKIPWEELMVLRATKRPKLIYEEEPKV